MKRFHDTHVYRQGRYSIGKDLETGSNYLSIPVANRLIDFEEYYRISADEIRSFTEDSDAALRFAEECRKRLHDDRIILAPGTDRGTAL